MEEKSYKKYTRIEKQVTGEPMTMQEYCDYRCWDVPKNENPKEEGYLVCSSDVWDTWVSKKEFELDFKVNK